MNILQVTYGKEWNGVKKHVLDIVKSLSIKNDHQIIVLCESDILKSKINSEFPNIKVILKNEYGDNFSIKKIIKQEKINTVHIHNQDKLLSAVILYRLFKVKKIIQTIHDWPYNEEENWFHKIKILIKFWLSTILSNKIILTNENDYNNCLYFPFIKNKINFIQNGIEIPIFMSVEGAKQLLAKKVGMELSLFKKKKILGTITSLNKNSGINYLIEASRIVIEKYKDVVFIVFGEGEYKDKIQELIIKNGLEKNFYLIGYVDHAKEYMKAFDIFVLPNIKHGLPYSIMEAGIANLPVISTSIGGVSDIVEDMKSGILVQIKKPKELAYAIFFTLEHIKEAKQYGKNLRDKVISKFTIQNMLNNLYNIYSK